MLFHPGPVQDSGNSQSWGVLLLLSSTHVSVQSLQPFSVVTRLAECSEMEVLNFSPLILHLLPLTLSPSGPFSSSVSQITVGP